MTAAKSTKPNEPKEPREAAERYNPVSRRLWRDEKFLALSAPKPNARTLWIFLLTGPHNTPLPGLFVLSVSGMAEELGWPAGATERCWGEIEAAGMAERDPATRLVWLPNALRHRAPRSPSNVEGWRLPLLELPSCALRDKAVAVLAEHVSARGEDFVKAWGRAMGGARPPAKETPKGTPKPPPMADPKRGATQTETQTQTEESPQPPASGGSDAGRTLGGEPATPPEAPAIASPARKSRCPPPESSPDVRALFAHWQTAMDSPRSVLDGKRASRLAWGLATFGAETCRAAIDGCASSPYHRGENETGTVYRSIGLIFRSVDHVERFAAMVSPARRGHGRADCDGPLDAFVAQEFPPVTPPPRLPGAPSVARVVVEDSPALQEATEQRRTMLRAQAAALLALQPEVTDGR